MQTTHIFWTASAWKQSTARRQPTHSASARQSDRNRPSWNWANVQLQETSTYGFNAAFAFQSSSPEVTHMRTVSNNVRFVRNDLLIIDIQIYLVYNIQVLGVFICDFLLDWPCDVQHMLLSTASLQWIYWIVRNRYNNKTLGIWWGRCRKGQLPSQEQPQDRE